MTELDPAALRLAGTSEIAGAADTLRELQEAQEYRIATSEILRVISRSAFDLSSVLLTVVTNATTLCRAEMSVLFRYQDGAYRFDVGHGLAPEYEAVERRQAIQPGPGTIIGRAALERRTVQIVDAWNEDVYAKKDDARLGQVRTMLGVPLLREGVPIGVIGLGRANVEPFTGRQIELVSTFADQAMIAIENVRLFEELQSARESAERERDLAEAARAEAEAADRAKSTFLAAMSHEIRTPMNGVLGMMEVLERSRLEPAQARCVAVMRESAQALLRIIDDVLDFSKIDAGRMDIERLPFSLGELGRGDGRDDAAAGGAEGSGAVRRSVRGRAGPGGRRPDAGAPDPVQPGRQRHQVHRPRVRPRQHRQPRGARRRRAGQHRRQRQRDRHGRGDAAHACSSRSRRPTARRRGASAAPAWACRSRAGSRS